MKWFKKTPKEEIKEEIIEQDEKYILLKKKAENGLNLLDIRELERKYNSEFVTVSTLYSGNSEWKAILLRKGGE